MKTAKLGGVLLLLMMLLSFSGCGHKNETQAVPEETPAATEGVAKDCTYTGTVRGRYETNMSFQSTGKIVACNVQVGTPVRSGDVLMVIDAKDGVQTGKQGDAQVEAAKEQMSQAQANLKRYTKLYQQKEIPAATLEQYQATYDAAFASYQNALAQAAQGHDALGYSSLTAGANGTISSVQAVEGQTVEAGQTVLTLMQTNELEIEIDVPQDEADEFSVGMSVQVDLPILGTQTEGVVREIAPLNEGDNTTYRVRISVPQPPSGMQLGMNAKVSFTENE